MVGDGYQGKGLGTELYSRLLKFAREEKVRTLHSDMLPNNVEMLAICKKLGFAINTPEQKGERITAKLEVK